MKIQSGTTDHIPPCRIIIENTYKQIKSIFGILLQIFEDQSQFLYIIHKKYCINKTKLSIQLQTIIWDLKIFRRLKTCQNHSPPLSSGKICQLKIRGP